MKKLAVPVLVITAGAVLAGYRVASAQEDEPSAGQPISTTSPQVTWRPPSTTGRVSPAVVAALRDALDDRVDYVRYSAAESLAQIGPAAAPAVPALIEATKDSSLEVRLKAIMALGFIGPGASAAVPRLMELLQHSERDVRLSAAYALAGIGAPAVPALLEGMESSSSRVRSWCATALGVMHDTGRLGGPAVEKRGVPAPSAP